MLSPKIKFYFFVERGLPGVSVIEGVWETEAYTCHTHVQGGNFRGTEDWLPELLNIIRIMRKPLSPEKRKKNVDNEQSYFCFKVNAQETQAPKRRASKPRAPINEGVTGPRTKKSFLVWSKSFIAPAGISPRRRNPEEAL